MKKRSLILLSLLLLLTAFCAVAAQAAAVPAGYICDCCGQDYAACNWQPWTGDHFLEGGHYYLEAPLEKTGQRQVGRKKVDDADVYATVNVTIDLNGFDYTNTSSRAFAIYQSSALNLVNSGKAATVTGSYPSSDIGGVINLTKDHNATLNVYKGVTLAYTDEQEFSVKNGKIIGAVGGGSINLLGGKVKDGDYYSGGAICLGKDSRLTVSDGSAIEKGFIKLSHSSPAANISISGTDAYLDLNGRNLTAAAIDRGTLYCMDAATNDYTGTYGTILNYTGDLQPVPRDSMYSAAEPDSDPDTDYTFRAGYMMLPEGENGLSFHRYYLAIEYVTLRTAVDKEGLYFNSIFAGDEQVQAQIASFGVALSKKDLQTAESWRSGMADGTSQYSIYRQEDFVTGTTPENQTVFNGTLLKNILQHTNTTDANVSNAETVVYGIPYIRLTDGTLLFGIQRQTSLAELIGQTDAAYDSLSEGQKAGLLLMYERFTDTMNKLSAKNVRASFDDDILAARRYTVWHEMEAMNDILWTVDKEVTFSINSSSKGLEADLAAQQAKDNYNALDDDVVTLYPDRVYRGLPYTHGCGNNDSVTSLGSVDENGVYHLSNVTPELFNGGSTNGANATTGAYNIARIGNDCWDMVFWAWSRISTTVTADHTRQMTPSFGVEIVGMDILENAMKENGVIAEDGSILDYICDQSTSSSIKGYYIYKNDTSSDIDGTRLVRYGVRTGSTSSTYDYQALYQTYTMLQKGDAMVRWRNSSGHAIMVGSVNVVMNGSKIDGEKSTITILEQGSGHEERQSRLESEFTSYTAAQHSRHTSINKKCMYCAGYTEEIIDGKHVWQLDYNKRELTFKELVEADYIGVTCLELNDNTMAEKAVVADQTLSTGISYLYTGKVSSNYHISQITLTITDANGKVQNETTCFAIQDGVRSPFDLARFVTDRNKGVLCGTPAITKSGTKLVSDTLAAGTYTYTYTVKLGNDRVLTMRTGSFTVAADGSIT